MDHLGENVWGLCGPRVDQPTGWFIIRDAPGHGTDPCLGVYVIMPKDGFSPLRRHETETLAAAAKRSAKNAKARDRRRKRGRPEEKAQKAFVAWARGAGIEVQHQNNGHPTKAGRIRLHAMGCTPGAGDVLVFDILPRDPAIRGLALEFKSDVGVQSDDQQGWQRRVVSRGWVYHLVRSATQAAEVCQWYGLAPGAPPPNP